MKSKNAIKYLYGVNPVSYTHLDVYKRQVNNPGYTYGIKGYAIHFNGTNQYVKLDDLETSRSFTVSFWVNPEDNGDWHAMLGKHESTGKNPVSYTHLFRCLDYTTS